jgi:hypothetical protein
MPLGIERPGHDQLVGQVAGGVLIPHGSGARHQHASSTAREVVQDAQLGTVGVVAQLGD